MHLRSCLDGQESGALHQQTREAITQELLANSQRFFTLLTHQFDTAMRACNTREELLWEDLTLAQCVARHEHLVPLAAVIANWLPHLHARVQDQARALQLRTAHALAESLKHVLERSALHPSAHPAKFDTSVDWPKVYTNPHAFAEAVQARPVPVFDPWAIHALGSPRKVRSSPPSNSSAAR
jgi:hypothetical protein